KEKVGRFDTELVQEFFQGFTNHAGITLHINLHYGTNTHHMIEAIFKAFARALDAASLINPRVKGIPSTKGLLYRSLYHDYFSSNRYFRWELCSINSR